MPKALAPLLALLPFLAGCSGGSEGGGSGSGPDVSALRSQFESNLELEVGDAAKIVRFAETGRKVEGGDSCVIEFEGEIAVSADCLLGIKERKKGEKVPFEANAEFVREGSGWRKLAAGFYPK